MSPSRRRASLIAAYSLALGALLSALLNALPAAAAAGNANFVGHWTDGGAGWVITTQDTSGACAGTSDYGGSYTLTNCQVNGTSYAFDIDYPPSYVSHNSGTIDGNTVTGSFHDSNGAGASYTAYRQDADPTVTAVTCPTSNTGIFTCTATVSDTTTPAATPSGTVAFTTTGGTVTTSCTLSAGSCQVTYTASAASNSTTTTLTGTYTSDQHLLASTGAATIAPVTLTGRTKTVNTYIGGHGQAVFNLALSRPSNLPVTLHVQTRDGSGKNGAHSKDGDYKKISETVTFAAGVVSRDVIVKAFPQIDLRRDATFSLDLSELAGATFASTTAGAAAAHLAGPLTRITERDASATSQITETINPDLVAGTIEDVYLLDSGPHPKPGHLWIHRYKTHKYVVAKKGTVVYVGDEISTEKDSVAAVHFVLGGEVGINPGSKVTVTSERSVREGDGGVLSVISHKIQIFKNLSNEKSQKLLIQTNGGVIGIKG